MLVLRLVSLALILTLAISSFGTLNTLASSKLARNYGLVDQACRTVDSFHLRSPGAEAPAGQTFTPTQTSVVGFSIDIQSQSGDPDVLAQIYSGGLSRASVIGQVHFSIPAGFGSNSSTGAWYHVSFPSGISITPNSAYALQLIDNGYSSGALFLWYQCTDTYSGGSYYICLGNSGPECGPSLTGSSFSFITYAGDFSIASSNLLVGRGSSNSTFVSVNSVFNFSSPVALSVGKSPDGVTTAFDISTVTPVSNSSANATLTVTAGDDIPIGTYSITLDATDGVLIHTAELNFTIEPSDFSVNVSSTNLHLAQGSNVSATITVASTYGFNSTVTLTPSWIGDAPSNVDITILSALIAVPGSSDLTISAGQHASTGNYMLRIKAVGDALTHSANVGVMINLNVTKLITSTVSTATPNVQQTLPLTSWLMLGSLVGVILVVTALVNIPRLRRIEKKIRSR
ncbi:MAG: hypothetical protein ACHQ03_00515 [Candidatus Bathyarchaeia archaeon]